MALVFGLVLTGCSTRLGTFTVISTKNIDWSRVGEFTHASKETEGSDKLHMILFIPTALEITIEDAVDEAIEKIPGAVALVDAVVRYRSFSFLLYSQTAYLVEGKPLIDPKMAVSAADSLGSNYLSFTTEDGKNWEKKAITQNEYETLLASAQ